MTPLTSLIGLLLGLFGICIAVVGQVFYTIYDERIWAMKSWRISNAMMFVWFIGFGMELWNGIFTATAYAAFYAVLFATNEYGLRRCNNV